MINQISSPLSFFVLGLATALTVAVTIKIVKISIPIIVNLGKKFCDLNFVVNIRSLFCNKCSQIHRTHLNKEANLLNPVDI